jgi:hypothetical protein
MQDSILYKMIFTNDEFSVIIAPDTMTKEEIIAFYLKDVGMYQEEEIADVVFMPDNEAAVFSVHDQEDGETYLLPAYIAKWNHTPPHVLCSTDWD